MDPSNESELDALAAIKEEVEYDLYSELHDARMRVLYLTRRLAQTHGDPFYAQIALLASCFAEDIEELHANRRASERTNAVLDELVDADKADLAALKRLIAQQCDQVIAQQRDTE